MELRGQQCSLFLFENVLVRSAGRRFFYAFSQKEGGRIACSNYQLIIVRLRHGVVAFLNQDDRKGRTIDEAQEKINGAVNITDNDDGNFAIVCCGFGAGA